MQRLACRVSNGYSENFNAGQRWLAKFNKPLTLEVHRAQCLCTKDNVSNVLWSARRRALFSPLLHLPLLPEQAPRVEIMSVLCTMVTKVSRGLDEHGMVTGHGVFGQGCALTCACIIWHLPWLPLGVAWYGYMNHHFLRF